MLAAEEGMPMRSIRWLSAANRYELSRPQIGLTLPHRGGSNDEGTDALVGESQRVPEKGRSQRSRGSSLRR
jgi:hypothetical protein